MFARDFAKDLIRFVDAGVTPFHVVAEVERRLKEKGFIRLTETNPRISFCGGGKYYVIRGGTSIIAFVAGSRHQSGHGFKIVAAHTDSPALHLKPNYSYTKNGYAEFGIEPYGGGIWRTWLDRDLLIAGRLVMRTEKGLVAKLVRLTNPVISVPSVAIHLDRDVNSKGEINLQTDLPALVSAGEIDMNRWENDMMWASGVSREFKEYKLISSSLLLYDAQNGSLAGMNKEFVRAGRLDDLASCHSALSALLDTKDPEETCVISFSDHEEVGSTSAVGARGTFLRDTLFRIAEHTAKSGSELIANSFCISSDMAHAVHPNHHEKHDPLHMSAIGRGPVVKWNPKQSYATTDITSAIFDDICKDAGVEYQKYVGLSSIPGGTTIGPAISSILGIQTIDVGIPMLAMHSIREQAGVHDHEAMARIFRRFFARGKEDVAML